MKFTGKNDGTKCIVRLLDDSEVVECEIQPRCKAQYLLDYVCQQLDVVEKDYFGLRYVDHRKQRRWFDFSKTVANQVKDVHHLVLCFRVKFYPADPMRLQEATRYQLYLQLKRDLQHGRLYSPGPGHDLAFLAALCIQEELGDFDPERHRPGYVSQMNLVLNQSDKFEAQVEDFHTGKTGALVGISSSQAVNAFIRKSATLDTYGIDPHPVKDQRGARLYIGTNHSGVATFHNGRRTHHFRWFDISKLNYEGRMFIIHIIIMEDARTKKKHTVGFKCASASACRLVWRQAVEQRIFYTSRSSKDIPAVVTGGSFFSRGSKVRYTGRVARELSLDVGQAADGDSASLRSQQSNQPVATSSMNRSVSNTAARSQREAFAARRSASEPVGDCYEQDDDYEDDEDSFIAQHMSYNHERGKRRRQTDLHGTLEEGSSASVGSITSSFVGCDSYEASSCASDDDDDDDDRSDVASWVALDLRTMKQRQRHQRSGQQNGYDTLTIDSDFYGYAPSQTSSATADGQSWAVPPPEEWSLSQRGRHSASPAHYLARYASKREDSWTDSAPRRHRHHHRRSSHFDDRPRSSPRSAVIPLPPPPPSSSASPGPSMLLTKTTAGMRQCRALTKKVLLLGTSIFTAFSLVALSLVIIYETDFHWAIHLRHWPEMIFIQRHLYMPLRNLFPL